jgi:type II secretory pathway pseudopilin PulG
VSVRPTDRHRAGVTPGDVLVVLSLLSLMLAIIYPRFGRTVFERRISAIVFEVEALRSAAQRHFEDSGEWPAEALPGVTPTELSDEPADEFSMLGEGVTLDWNVWEAVRDPDPVVEEQIPDEENPNLESLAQPPLEGDDRPRPGPTIHPFAAITVHSGEASILAALFERYGGAVSFLHDGSWTLILAHSP